MQVQTVQHGTSGNIPMTETVKFDVEANGHIFSMMTDRIYNNPIGSIVRELGSNAWDSHMAAGHPERPWVIHVPNVLEPYFEVQDFGTGMSHESMQKVYPRLGVSTKRDENDSIGGFGLGSKTPLAYTMQFTVTSIFDGVRREYIVVNDGNGPELSLISETPTDEHPGMKIHFGVEPEDFAKFRQEILRQLRFFAVKPITTNVDLSEDWFDTEAHVEQKIAGATMYTRDAYLQGVFIVQGGVGYKLRPEELDADEDIISACGLLAMSGTALHFNIGEIAPSVNREDVQYNKQTKANIINRISIVAEKIAEAFIAEARTHTVMIDRARFINNASDSMRTFAKMRDDYDEVFPKEWMNTENYTVTMPFKNVPMVTRGEGESAFTLPKFGLVQYCRKDGKRSAKRPQKITVKHGTATFGLDAVFLVRDTKKQPVARLTAFWNSDEHNRKMLYVFENERDEFTDAEIAEIESSLGGIKCKRMSSLPEIERTRRARGDGVYITANAWQWHPCEGISRDSKEWDKITDDLEDITTAVYVVVHRHNFEELYKVQQLLTFKMLGMVDEDIYAVNRKTAEAIQKNDEDDVWVSVDEVLERDHIVAGIERAEAYQRSAARLRAILKGIKVPGIMNTRRDLWESELPNGTQMQRLMRTVNLLEKRATQLERRTNQHWWRVINQNRVRLPEGEVTALVEKGNAMTATVTDKYPVLPHMMVGYDLRDSAVRAAIDYVKMIDRGA